MNMSGRHLGIGAAFAVLAALLHAGGAAQGPNNRAQGPNNRAQETVINAIKAEGLRSSEAPVLFHTLTDGFGARLTGSPAHLEAARWALERLRRWGLQNPQLEPFEFGRGWELEKLTVEMIAPRYMPLIGYAEAWSPPTAGLRPGAMEHGTVRVQGNRDTARNEVPSVVLAAEHYNMLVRLVQAGVPVQLRIEVGARFYENDRNSYNVLAEIPGADPVLRDEVVLVGAHLDSWHTATGATDNADGVTAVMEAMRILASVNARPRRTIRVALWAGEEQGLLGAQSYVDSYLRDETARGRLSVYLNDDPGTGATYGFYMQRNEAAKRIFDGWLEPLRDIGVRRNVIEGIGATDHLPFDAVGIPAFTVIKDFRNYDVRTRHTNADLADAVKAEDLRQSAVVLAVVAWQAAMRDQRIPRRP